MYYAIFDRDKGDYMAIGLNETNKEKLINEALDHFVSSEKAMRNKLAKMSLKQKEVHLETTYLVVVDESKEPFPEPSEEE